MKIFEVSEFSIFAPWPKSETQNFQNCFFASNFDTGCYSRFQNVKTKNKWTETKTKNFRYDLEEK